MVPTFLVLPFGEEHASGKVGENVKGPKLDNPTSSIEVAVNRTSKYCGEASARRICDGCRGIRNAGRVCEGGFKSATLTARTYICEANDERRENKASRRCDRSR